MISPDQDPSEDSVANQCLKLKRQLDELVTKVREDSKRFGLVADANPLDDEHLLRASVVALVGEHPGLNREDGEPRQPVARRRPWLPADTPARAAIR